MGAPEIRENATAIEKGKFRRNAAAFGDHPAVRSTPLPPHSPSRTPGCGRRRPRAISAPHWEDGDWDTARRATAQSLFGKNKTPPCRHRKEREGGRGGKGRRTHRRDFVVAGDRRLPGSWRWTGGCAAFLSRRFGWSGRRWEGSGGRSGWPLPLRRARAASCCGCLVEGKQSKCTDLDQLITLAKPKFDDAKSLVLLNRLMTLSPAI